jgi:KDO2-lipid IV(A) lauroyltransferase
MLRRLRHRLEYALVVVLGGAIRVLPLAWIRALGRGLGRTAFRAGVARRTARANVERYLGITDPGERDRLLLRAYAGFGQTAVEIVYTPAMSNEAIKAEFDFEGLEEIQRLRAAGRGVVCMSAHYGNWEWMGAALVQAGVPMTLLVGTQSNPWTDRAFLKLRADKGLEMVRLSAVRECLRALKARRMVALLGDQDGDKWGVFAPFFGVPASTFTLGELMARRSGSAIAFGVALRGPDGRSSMRAHILPDPPADLSPALATAWTLAEYNRLLEAAIREHPEQWLWMHNRWRSVPLHRLAGEERARAERGEIVFDCARQVWTPAGGGEALAMETWK